MKIGYEFIYGSYKELLIHSENISWSRLQNLLTINSILVVAWATLFATNNGKYSLSAAVVMTFVSLVGLFTGLVWASLGKTGREYLDRYKEKLREIEDHYDKARWWEECIPISDRPFRVQVVPGRFASSTFLLVRTPQLFAVLNLVLLITTWWSYVTNGVRVI